MKTLTQTCLLCPYITGCELAQPPEPAPRICRSIHVAEMPVRAKLRDAYPLASIAPATPTASYDAVLTTVKRGSGETKAKTITSAIRAPAPGPVAR